MAGDGVLAAAGTLLALTLTACGTGGPPLTSVSQAQPPVAIDFHPDDCPMDIYEEALACFMAGAEASLESVWAGRLAGVSDYQRPTVVVFDKRARTACGSAKKAYGPVHCAADSTIYLPWQFLVTAGEYTGAQGPFSAVIVLAHEWAHQIQQAIGVDEAYESAQEAEFGSANAVSVRTELMADCLAGWWAGHADALGQFPLLPEDIEDAALVMAEVGDDVQAEIAGTGFEPETWDHGTAEQRDWWLIEGFDAGVQDLDPLATCDTFGRPTP